MLKQLEGIVLKTQDYGETHKLITVFTKQFGKLTAISRGANKPKSKLSAVSQAFIQGDFLIYVSKGLSTIQQGQIIQSFRHIREDIEKTAYAAYMIELTDKTLESKNPIP
ncbi:MAG TPA: DNA repair protein RecO, partial [Pseudogracilibacillus sp.]|nr:DNA repair protein RecO [Pseudogracilibacillus sp.]